MLWHHFLAQRFRRSQNSPKLGNPPAAGRTFADVRFNFAFLRLFARGYVLNLTP
jgi:hypothetical protein